MPRLLIRQTHTRRTSGHVELKLCNIYSRQLQALQALDKGLVPIHNTMKSYSVMLPMHITDVGLSRNLAMTDWLMQCPKTQSKHICHPD